MSVEQKSLASKLAKAFAHPGRAMLLARGLLKGQWYKFWYPLRGVRFRAGKHLRVNGRLDIRGPGEVIFGDNVVVNGHATPWTQSAKARIILGNNVMLGSTRFGCVQEIQIGDDCLIASAVFTDSDFHSPRADRRTDAAPVRVAPVRLERNVWVGENAGILPGTTIGENSVIGFGTVCMRSYPPNVIVLGNPGKVVGPIPSIPDAAAPAGVEPSIPGAAGAAPVTVPTAG